MRPEPLRRERARPSHQAAFAPLRYPDWMSGRGVLVAMRLEREQPHSPSLPWALHIWRMLVDEPLRRVDPGQGCGAPECCVDIDEVREVLRAAVRSLPARDSRRLRRRLRCMPHRWSTR